MKLNDIIASIEQLPATPQVLPKLMKVLRDPEASANEIVEIIRLDPSLTAQVLKVSNSGYYAVPEGNSDLSRAISHIGLGETYRIVSSLVGKAVASHPVKAYEIDGQELWFSAIAAAVTMDLMARKAHQDPIDAYTIGLFHNLGKLVINNTAGEAYQPVFEKLENETCSQVEAEREVLGFDYAEVGAILLEHWEFPDELHSPVRFQLDPMATSEHRELAAMLHVSLFVLSGIGYAYGRDAFAFKVIPEVLELLYMSEEDVEQLMIDVHNRVEEIKGLFAK